MITAGDFRKGKTVVIDGKVCTIVDFMHVKPGKGAAFVRTKYKDIINGGVMETSFNPTAKFDEAHIDRTKMTYSFDDGDMYNFMDPETFEMVAVSHEDAADQMKYVIENIKCTLSSYQGKVFAVEPPFTVILQITESEPGVAGNTATNATKPATLETGAEIRVPLFVNEGDYVKVDTREGGAYLGRATADDYQGQFEE